MFAVKGTGVKKEILLQSLEDTIWIMLSMVKDHFLMKNLTGFNLKSTYLLSELLMSFNNLLECMNRSAADMNTFQAKTGRGTRFKNYPFYCDVLCRL